MIDSEYWARYYAVTVERPAWETVRVAIERFAAEDADPARIHFAVDLGSGAGRDARELLRAGWRVLAIDRERAAVDTLEASTPDALRPRLTTRVTDLATLEVPPCDLVNASLSLPFLASKRSGGAGAGSSMRCPSVAVSPRCRSGIGMAAPVIRR